MHESLTFDRIMAAAEQTMFGIANTGFCEACGNEQEGCEPDAHKYKCEACGEHDVTGAEDLLLAVC